MSTCGFAGRCKQAWSLMPSSSETQAAVGIAQFCSKEILSARAAGPTVWAKFSLLAAQFLMCYVKWWESLVSSTDRLWLRTFPLLPGWSLPQGKSGDCLGTQSANRSEVAVMYVRSPPCCASLDGLFAQGGSSFPIYSLPCSLGLNPHLLDQEKKHHISAAAPPPFPPFQPFLKKSGDAHEPQLHPPSRTVPQEDPAGRDFVQGVSAQAGFPHARLAVLKACDSSLPPKPQGCPGCAVQLLVYIACQAPACFSFLGGLGRGSGKARWYFSAFVP